MNDLTSPRFWQDRVHQKDCQINKLNLLLNETEGKLQGFAEISSQRHSLITQLESKIVMAHDELNFMKDKLRRNEHEIEQKNLVIDQMQKKVDL